MANRQHVSMLKQGSGAWNAWRKQNPDLKPDLREAALAGMALCDADLSSANLTEADLSGADLRSANLAGATLWGAALPNTQLSQADLSFADLTYADLSHADLIAARLWKADLTAARLLQANLENANLSTATLRESDLSAATLNGANLNYALLIETNLKQASLTGCSVHNICAWDVRLDESVQSDLIITLPNEPTITVDTLELAQFLSLLLNQRQLQQVITGITSRVVLVLGRLIPERKAALEAIKEALRRQHYSPVLFDFEKPLSRDFSATVGILARVARFIIADLTPRKSIGQELQATIPHVSVPVQPLVNGSKKVYSLFPEFKKYPWVLPGYNYRHLSELLGALDDKVIRPAEEKAKELEKS